MNKKSAKIDSVVRVSVQQSELLATLHQESFSRGEQWSAQAMADLLKSPYVWAGVALWQKEPVGMIMVQCVAEEAEILTLCVSSQRRRQGMARALVTWGQSIAMQEGAYRLFLEVSVKNTGAIALYEQAGFVQCGLRKRYYLDGSDAYLCEKMIRNNKIR